MKRIQWFVLAWSFMLMGMMFIGLDISANKCLNLISETAIPYSIYDTWCIVNAEILEPFIYTFYALFVVFMILGFLEKKK